MIYSYSDIYKTLNNQKPNRLGVINPQSDYLLEAISKAVEFGWIEPISFFSSENESASYKAIKSVNNGDCQLLMKGDINTSTLLKAVLDSEFGIKTEKILSHIAVIESPKYHKLLLISDGGVNIKLDEPIIDSIIHNSVIFSKCLEIAKPKIGLLTLVEQINPMLPETQIAYNIFQKNKENTKIIIEGPISLDVAISKESANKKNILSRISGQTDIIIGPSISTSNMIVKALMSLSNAKGGGIILGAKCPIVLLSRSDSINTKLNSIALSLLMLKRGDYGY
ncbi:MAG: phosphate butyryltransferase [Candidatus Marinimicrobia bacterium]|nr:phosphate butyryltransferase [Candidatus Neomarinimicrobiota bacterium]